MAKTDPPVSSKTLIILVSCDPSESKDLAQGLIQEGLAACVNEIPSVLSNYRWDEKTLRDPETLLVIKTTAEVYPDLEKWVKTHHSYDLPEILAIPVIAGAQEYLNWVHESVTGTR